MSLGPRCFKGAKSAAIACLASTPREPLLFLYPSWRSYSTSSSALDPSQDGDSRSIPPYQASIRPHVNVELAKGRLDQATGHTKAVNAEGDGNHTPNLGIEQPAAPRTRKFIATHRKNSAKPPQTSLERRVSSVYSNFGRAKAKEIRDQDARAAYQGYRREKKQSSVPDWRTILDDLSQNTPENERRLMAAEVTITENSVETVLRGIDDNVWDIADRYSCAVELCTQDPKAKVYRTFLLSGPPTAISKAAADIFWLDPNAKMIATNTGVLPRGSEGNLPDFDSIRGEGVQRPRNGKVRNTISTKSHVAPITRAGKNTRPAQWTQRSFAEYIADLTASGIPNHLHTLMYKPTESHVSSIVRILRELFLDPECRPYLSRKAFTTAMEYFVERSRIADARVFFVHMELMGISMDVKTFNTLLQGAAKNNDLYSFQFILHLMLRRNISPNSSTWVAFVMLVPDLRVKLSAFDKMKELGLLWNIDTMKDVCKQLVADEMSASLDKSQTQAEFLDHMDSRYGPAWLTKMSGSRIIEVLGLRGLISRCWNFLSVMIDRSITPHKVCVNTILNHCMQVGNIKAAVELLWNLPPSIRFIPDETTYHILFAMAWRGKRYNLARVIWRYACLNAYTTRLMRLRVLKSLLSPEITLNSGQPPPQSFGHLAGRVISPTEDFKSHPVLVYRQCFKDAFGFHLTEDNREMEEVFAGNTSGEEPTTSPTFQSRNLPNSLKGFPERISHDCEVFQWWEPVRPFSEMLTEACKLDEEWMDLPVREDGQNPKMVSWLLQNAISVPIRAEIDGKEILTEWR